MPVFRYSRRMTLPCFIILFLAIGSSHTFATSGNITIYIYGTETITVGVWNLPWPFDNYRMNFYAIPSFDGSNKVSWTVDRDLISPGGSVSSRVNLNQGDHYYRMDFRVVVIDESTSDVIIDQIAGIDLGSIEVPGSWSSPSQLVVPVVPFEIIGIPMELSIYFRFSLSSWYLLAISTYGLQPQTTTLEYSSTMARNVEFGKTSSVGAEIVLSSAQVKVEGSITVSPGLSVAGFPTPLKIDFASVPIGEWSTIRPQDVSMATLKTPITVEASVDTTVVTLGEDVIVSGQVIPQAKSINVQLVAADMAVGTTQTREDGSFSFRWQPTYAGTFALFVKSSETKYTTSASSSTIELVVNRPPEASFTCSPLNPSTTDEVHFTDTSSDIDGQIATWLWDFGDGHTSSQKNPIHKYVSEGTYTVKLTISDDHDAKATHTEILAVKTSAAIGGTELFLIGAIAATSTALAAAFVVLRRRTKAASK